MKTVIYGAQAIAYGTYRALKTITPEKEIQCFVVTERGLNGSVLDGLPILELSEFVYDLSQKEKDDTEVLIATPEAVMDKIEKSLDEVGLLHYERLDSVKWGKLQEEAFTKTGEFRPLATYAIGNLYPEIYIFKMVHEKDKQLETLFMEQQYVQRLQVGAALSDKQIASLQDCTGENISKKNGNYSELTGLFWMWKNRITHKSDKYYGLAHYRRFFDLSEDDLYRLLSNDIDVVLPYPMPYNPNIEAHHLRYLSDEEWNVVLQALQELQPEYAKSFEEILKQKYLYNYNVILAKGSVLDDYCSWLFPILFRVEELHDPNGEKPSNRFIGYVGETLETLYFMHNKLNLRIAHTTCRFII